MIAGQYITDGTAIFIIRDTRDGIPVGMIFTDSFLRDSCIKVNGAEVQRSSYLTIVELMRKHPELVTTEALWPSNKHLFTWGGGTATTGNTIRLPDVRGLYEQLSDSIGVVKAGLPNATGYIARGGMNDAGGVFYNGAGFSGVGDHSQPNSYAHLDLSRASSIYGNSDTVTPPTVRRVAQMKY